MTSEGRQERERFIPGPIRTGPGTYEWAWLDENGFVRRLTVGARLRNPQAVGRIHEAARAQGRVAGPDGRSRIIRPHNGQLVRVSSTDGGAR